MSKKNPTIQEMIEDFKQYVDHNVANTVNSTVRESEDRIKKELGDQIKEAKEEIRQEMRDGFEGVADAVGEHQDQIDDHDSRISKLDLKLAK